MKSLKILKSEQGFTLVELMVSVAILSFLIIGFTAYMYQQTKQGKMAENRQSFSQLKGNLATVTAQIDCLTQSQTVTTDSPNL